MISLAKLSITICIQIVLYCLCNEILCQCILNSSFDNSIFNRFFIYHTFSIIILDCDICRTFVIIVLANSSCFYNRISFCERSFRFQVQISFEFREVLNFHLISIFSQFDSCKFIHFRSPSTIFLFVFHN